MDPQKRGIFYSILSIIFGIGLFIFSGGILRTVTFLLAALGGGLGYIAIKNGVKLGYVGILVIIVGYVFQIWLLCQFWLKIQ